MIFVAFKQVTVIFPSRKFALISASRAFARRISFYKLEIKIFNHHLVFSKSFMFI